MTKSARHTVPANRAAWPLPPLQTVVWIGVYVCALAWSGIAPKDRMTWWLEVAPALIGAGLLLWTWRRFPLTPLAYWLILVHSLVLMVGGHYTYADVPLFDWLREPLGWTRNNYDKLGHFAQGFIPAIVAREILLRLTPLRRGGWLTFIVITVCLAISALYEIVEWIVALLSGTAADAFLGTQGYIWDTQSDMAFALFGAVVAALSLSRFHDRQLAALRRAAL